MDQGNNDRLVDNNKYEEEFREFERYIEESIEESIKESIYDKEPEAYIIYQSDDYNDDIIHISYE